MIFSFIVVCQNSRHHQLRNRSMHQLNQLLKMVMLTHSPPYSFLIILIVLVLFAGKTINNNTTTTGNGNGIIQKNPLPPVSIPKERRRTVSFRKGVDPREELLRRSTTPDVKDVSSFSTTTKKFGIAIINWMELFYFICRQHRHMNLLHFPCPLIHWITWFN